MNLLNVNEFRATHSFKWNEKINWRNKFCNDTDFTSKKSYKDSYKAHKQKYLVFKVITFRNEGKPETKVIATVKQAKIFLELFTSM